MACWLYQMKAEEWPHERYRSEVWEGSVTTAWGVRKITPSTGMPKHGDIMVLFYAKATAPEPGAYGWGIVLWCDGQEINFRPASPSDYLKMSPMWDGDIDDIINIIRGKVARGTMWKVNDEPLKRLRQKVAEHVYGKPLST